MSPDDDAIAAAKAKRARRRLRGWNNAMMQACTSGVPARHAVYFRVGLENDVQRGWEDIERHLRARRFELAARK